MFPNFANFTDRRPRWTPPKQRAYWESRNDVEPRGIDPRPKFEPQSKVDQRPKYIPKSRVDAKTMFQRNLTVIVPKPKSEIHQEELKHKIKPKLAEVKPKAVQTPATKVETKISLKAKEDEKQSPKNTEAPKQKVVQGPPSDEIAETSHPVGYYELSPLMSRMLDTELQDIMIKIWQELPDNPTNEADKLVVNKFRSKAGDDLRNVFGLNVTKRLLNVFNMLYIRMKFSAKPDGQELSRFLIKNDISNFKWNNMKPLTYTAVVKNVKDFDRLCATQVFTINTVKVTITPLYQFTKCPIKLRTSFHIDDIKNKNVAPDISGKKTEEIESENDNKTKPTLADTKTIKEKVPENPPNKVTKETVTNANVPKDKSKEATKATNIKPNSNIKSVEQQNKKVVKEKIESKPITKKVPIKKNVEKKPKPSGRSILQAGNDFDELNDDEIMALVSQGIILDQCSGSDEE